jgi:hypothetical protein
MTKVFVQHRVDVRAPTKAAPHVAQLLKQTDAADVCLSRSILMICRVEATASSARRHTEPAASQTPVRWCSQLAHQPHKFRARYARNARACSVAAENAALRCASCIRHPRTPRLRTPPPSLRWPLSFLLAALPYFSPRIGLLLVGTYKTADRSMLACSHPAKTIVCPCADAQPCRRVAQLAQERGSASLLASFVPSPARLLPFSMQARFYFIAHRRTRSLCSLRAQDSLLVVRCWQASKGDFAGECPAWQDF